MPEPEVIVTIGADVVPASRADEVETAAREALAALDPPVGCATVRRVVGEPPAGWEDAACERLRVAESVNADLREELGMALAALGEALDVALPTTEEALSGVLAEVDRRRDSHSAPSDGQTGRCDDH